MSVPGYNPAMRLIECKGCNRHVRENEASCPFCGADVADVIAAAPRWDPPRGLSRTALRALAAATFGVGACNTSTAIYGAPAFDGGVEACKTLHCPKGLTCNFEYGYPRCACHSDEACGSPHQVCYQNQCTDLCVADSTCKNDQICVCAPFGLCMPAGTPRECPSAKESEPHERDAAADATIGTEASVSDSPSDAAP